MKLLTLELDFQVNVCLFTWSCALYMVAVDFLAEIRAAIILLLITRKYIN
jgi:hypothetical protein